MHLVDFIISIYHDARSSECQNLSLLTFELYSITKHRRLPRGHFVIKSRREIYFTCLCRRFGVSHFLGFCMQHVVLSRTFRLNTPFLFSSLYRAIERDIEVIRPTIYTRVFFVLISLQF